MYKSCQISEWFTCIPVLDHRVERAPAASACLHSKCSKVSAAACSRSKVWRANTGARPRWPKKVPSKYCTYEVSNTALRLNCSCDTVGVMSRYVSVHYGAVHKRLLWRCMNSVSIEIAYTLIITHINYFLETTFAFNFWSLSTFSLDHTHKYPFPGLLILSLFTHSESIDVQVVRCVSAKNMLRDRKMQ